MENESLNDYCGKIIYGGLLLFIFSLPLIIFPGANYKFAIAKWTLFRLIIPVIIGAWLAKVIYGRKIEYRRTPLDIPLIFFFLATATSTFFSISPLLSITGAFSQRQEGLLTIFGYLVLFFATTHFLDSQKRIETALKVFVSPAILISLYGFFQHFGYDIFAYDLTGEEKISSFATLGNPAFLGSYLVLILPIVLILILIAGGMKERLFWLLVTVFSGTTLVLTYTRGAWIGALVAFLAVIALTLIKKELGRLRRRVIMVLVFIFVITTIILLFFQSQGGLSTPIIEKIASSLEFSRGTVGERLIMWRDTLKLISARPFLGWGPETFKDAFAKYRSLRLARLEGERRAIERPHNQTLYVASTLGAVGLLSYFWLIIVFMAIGQLSLRNISDKKKYLLMGGVFSAALGYLVQEQFLFSLISVTPLFWILLGLMMNLRKVNNVKVISGLVEYLSPLGQYVILLLLIFFVAILSVFSLRFAKADFYSRKGREGIVMTNFKEAASSFEEAVRLNPWESKYPAYLGAIYHDIAMRDQQPYWLYKAIRIYQSYLQANPFNFVLHYGLGNAYYALAKLEANGTNYFGAKSSYEKAVELDPHLSDAHFRLGVIFLQEKSYFQAIEHFSKVLKISPKNVDALYGLGLAYRTIGQPEKAIKYFRQVLEIEPNYQGAQENLQHLLAGK